MSSATYPPGYLTPSTEITPVNEDFDLDTIVQQMVMGITGLPDFMVRPRWQPSPPKEPSDLTADWCGVGVIDESPMPGMEPIVHHGTGAIGDTDTGPLSGGWDETQCHVCLDILASFYGQNARTNASLLHDGLNIDQNRAMLTAQGLGLVETSSIRLIPELVNDVWRRRADIHIFLYYFTRLSWPVRNINESSGTIETPDGVADTFDTDNVSHTRT